MKLNRSKISPYLALTAVFAGVFIAADDQTVVVTVLPQVMLDMGVQVNELNRASWTITGYLLGYLVAMPFIGRASDVWGHRRVFLLSMTMFMIGSAAVALTSSLNWLIAARVFQALGAGALVPVSIAMVGDLFPAQKRGVPLGIMGASAEAGGVIGPLWGGIIIKYLSWQWVFWINLPLGAAVIALTFLLIEPSPRTRSRVDYIGGGLITASLATLTLGLARIDEADWLMAIYMAASFGLFWLFVLRQRSTPEPLLPSAMFKTWAFRASNAVHILVGAALIIGMVTIPLMANTVMGLTPLDGGLQLIRLTAAIPVGAVLGGIAAQRMDYRIPTVIGLALAAIGFWLMSGWDLTISDPALTIHLATAGLGFGLVIAPIALAATNSVHQDNRGTAASLITATRITGMTLGLAALTAWGTGHFGHLVSGLQVPFQLSGESTTAYQQRLEEFQRHVTDAGLTIFNEFFLVASALCALAIVAALFMKWDRNRTPET
ncbi:MAG: MFS transporter [Chloroflexi bacterium]|nr:MFS transporter [Chloroflexota bacterium]